MAQDVGTQPPGPQGQEGKEQREEEQGNQLGNKVDDDRESIWTIPARLKRWYFALFSIQVIIAAIWLVKTAIADESQNGVPDILFYVWQYMAPAAVSSATLALVIVDTVNGIMVLSTWLQETLEKRRLRQIKAAEDAGVARGRAEAVAELQQKWEDWNKRREAAAGEEFNEPPPGAASETEDAHQ